MQQVRRSAEERLRALHVERDELAEPEPHVSRETSAYLPMQKVAKIRSSTSSTPTAPGDAADGPGRQPQVLGQQRQLGPAGRQRREARQRRLGLGDRRAMPGAGQQRRVAGRHERRRAARPAARAARRCPHRSGRRSAAAPPGSAASGARSILLATRIVAVAPASVRPRSPASTTRSRRSACGRAAAGAGDALRPRSDRRSRAGPPCRAA